jgi:hypothetical protein
VLLIANLYNFSVHWSDNQKDIQREELQNDRIKKAWNYLYEHARKTGKQEMDSAYTKTASN